MSHCFLYPILQPPSPVLCSCSHSAGLPFSTSSHLLCPLLHLLVITHPSPSYPFTFPLAFTLSFLIPPFLHQWAKHITLSCFLPSFKLCILYFLLSLLAPTFSRKNYSSSSAWYGVRQVAKCTSVLFVKKYTLAHSQTLWLHPFILESTLASHTATADFAVLCLFSLSSFVSQSLIPISIVASLNCPFHYNHYNSSLIPFFPPLLLLCHYTTFCFIF